MYPLAERDGVVVNTTASCLEGSDIRGNCLLSEAFHSFPPSRKIDHDQILPRPFQFIIQNHTPLDRYRATIHKVKKASLNQM